MGNGYKRPQASSTVPHTRIDPAHGQTGSVGLSDRTKGSRPLQTPSPTAGRLPGPPSGTATGRSPPEPCRQRFTPRRQDRGRGQAGRTISTEPPPASQATALRGRRGAGGGEQPPARAAGGEQPTGERLPAPSHTQQPPPPTDTTAAAQPGPPPPHPPPIAASHPRPGPAAPLPPRRAQGRGSAPPRHAGRPGRCSSPALFRNSAEGPGPAAPREL